MRNAKITDTAETRPEDWNPKTLKRDQSQKAARRGGEEEPQARGWAGQHGRYVEREEADTKLPRTRKNRIKHGASRTTKLRRQAVGR